MEHKTVTPTLSSSTGYVEDVRDQVATIIRYIVMNPGGTSSLWENELLSMRKAIAEYEHDRYILANFVRNKLMSIYRRMFGDYIIDVEIVPKDYKEGVPDGRYALEFSVTIDHKVHGTMSGLVSGRFTVDPETYAINVEYADTMDNTVI